MTRKQSEYLSKKAIDKFYEQVAIDIENGIQDKGVWARCFSESKGNEKKAKALYIEAMVDELVLKAEALEEQRIEKEEARIEKEEARERIAQEKREKIEEEKRLKEKQKRYEEANTLERFFIKTKEKILNFFIIAFYAVCIWFLSLGVVAISDDLFDTNRVDGYLSFSGLLLFGLYFIFAWLVDGLLLLFSYLLEGLALITFQESWEESDPLVTFLFLIGFVGLIVFFISTFYEDEEEE